MVPRSDEHGTSSLPGRHGSTSPAASRAGSNSSSKAPSPTETINFRFLNFANPQESRNAQTRRDIRSHVTSRQHRMQRRTIAEQANSSRQSSSSDTDVNFPAQPDHIPSEFDVSSPDEASSPPSPCDAVSSGLPLRRINVAEVYPLDWHPFLGPLMDHYLYSMTVDLPADDIESRAIMSSHFMAVVLSDRAPLHAVMLTAAAHYAKIHGPQSHTLDLLQLKGLAIEEINRTLTDHRVAGRAISDQLVIAVSKMATFELLFGIHETFHMHMTGLQRMVSLRGGLHMLGVHGLLERSLLWLDSNAASIHGVLYFTPESFPSSMGHPQPDVTAFMWGVQASPH